MIVVNDSSVYLLLFRTQCSCVDCCVCEWCSSRPGDAVRWWYEWSHCPQWHCTMAVHSC